MVEQTVELPMIQDAWSAPSHHLNQRWYIVNRNIGKKFREVWISLNTTIFIQKWVWKCRLQNQILFSEIADEISQNRAALKSYMTCMNKVMWSALYPFHKSHNALDKCPTIHHVVGELCTYVHFCLTKWCIVRYRTVALWDLYKRSIVRGYEWIVYRGSRGKMTYS